MDDISTAALLPIPVRTLSTDAPAEIFEFAVERFQAGGDVAVAFLVEIRGGAARGLGAPMVIDAEGRFCGYVSSGCTEAAVAAEALLAMRTGCDRIVKFGAGSPFFDIALPCGGGISVAIHVLRDETAVKGVLAALALRHAVGMKYSPERQTLEIADAPRSAGWEQGFRGSLSHEHPTFGFGANDRS
ncbi:MULTISPECIES: XdhC family protein [Rhizobium]|uniref:XdhC family protein n=1 Tax=Rhizobium TaxID=379 RepID=UPI002180BA22|nr:MULTISPECIES: XdhC family protein [Rhizobium]